MDEDRILLKLVMDEAGLDWGLEERLSQFPLKLGGLDNFSNSLRYVLVRNNVFLQGIHE